MVLEKAIQDALAAVPEFIEDGLRLVRREAPLAGEHHRRLDLQFSDREGRRLLVELKRTMIQDKDVGQLIRYAGMLILSEGSAPPLRLMLIGTRVAPNLKAGLKHIGIECRELDLEELRGFLLAGGHEQLASRLRHGISDQVQTNPDGATGVRKTAPLANSERAGAGSFSVMVAGQRIGPARFPVLMREIYETLIFVHSIAPEDLLSCSNVRHKQRWAVLPCSVATKEEFAKRESDSLCEQGRFEIFEVNGKTCGITTHWGAGGSRRVLRHLQKRFLDLKIAIEDFPARAQ